MKKIKLTIIFVIISICLNGCVIGHVKNAKEIIDWVNMSYDIQSKIVASENLKSPEDGIEQGRKYIMENQDGVTFTAISEMGSFGMDGSTFGYSESTYTDYYKRLIEANEDNIKNIEKKYNIKFLKTTYDGEIYGVYKIGENIENNPKELKHVSKAIEELKDIIKPTYEYKSSIYLMNDTNGDDWTDWYYIINNTSQNLGHKNNNGVGPYNSVTEEFKYQETDPQIIDDLQNHVKRNYKNPEILQNGFIIPKTLLYIEFNADDLGCKKLYVDLVQYNELFDKYNGIIPNYEFDKIVINEQIDIYNYKPYQKNEK